ncbi:transmembrane protein 267 [Caerostris extrusa]|uniref:Transmembrane protein 267 n=1 Tax=Caerostris extrusa TaxID=172846 RepID=A0AAV4XCQ2_CAEEX|nr:transmembrane protein 267 [Caerostris extrusa]
MLCKVYFCGLIAGSIDLDHFLMAKSLKFKDAINLSSRPPFHNTTLMAMLAIFLISLTHLKGNELCEYIGWYILVATISHHLRDALRHGLWIWPWTTKVLHFISYLILSYLFPLAVGFMLRINKRIIFVKVKTFDVIQV